jgi:hypothetical protein
VCDLRIASETAKLWLPELMHGVVPDSGGVARLFQIAGMARGRHGAHRSGHGGGEALSSRHRVESGSDDELDDPLEMAHKIAKLPAFSVKLFRRDLSRIATFSCSSRSKKSAPRSADLPLRGLSRIQGGQGRGARSLVSQSLTNGTDDLAACVLRRFWQDPYPVLDEARMPAPHRGQRIG